MATHITLLADQLVRRGHDVTVAVGWHDGPRVTDHRAAGAVIADAPLIDLLASGHFDVANLTDNDTRLLPPRAIALAGCPVVTTAHSEHARLDVQGVDRLVLVRAGQVA